MKGKIGTRSLEGSWLSLAGSDAVPGKRMMATVDEFLYSDFLLFWPLFSEDIPLYSFPDS